MDSIICNNCFGSRISQDLGYKYNSPLAGLYIPYPDYIVFLKHLRGFLNSPVILEDTPPNPAKTDNGKYKNYPRGFIVYEGEKVHIRFLHYKDGKEAIEKWNRRSRRVNYDRLFVVGSEVDGCTEHDIEQFTNLPYEKKIFFTKYKYAQFSDSKIVMDIPEMGKPNFISLYGMAHLGYKLICRQAKL